MASSGVVVSSTAALVTVARPRRVPSRKMKLSKKEDEFFSNIGSTSVRTDQLDARSRRKGPCMKARPRVSEDVPLAGLDPKLRKLSPSEKGCEILSLKNKTKFVQMSSSGGPRRQPVEKTRKRGWRGEKKTGNFVMSQYYASCAVLRAQGPEDVAKTRLSSVEKVKFDSSTMAVVRRLDGDRQFNESRFQPRSDVRRWEVPDYDPDIPQYPLEHFGKKKYGIKCEGRLSCVYGCVCEALCFKASEYVEEEDEDDDPVYSLVDENLRRRAGRSTRAALFRNLPVAEKESTSNVVKKKRGRPPLENGTKRPRKPPAYFSDFVGEEKRLAEARVTRRAEKKAETAVIQKKPEAPVKIEEKLEVESKSPIPSRTSTVEAPTLPESVEKILPIAPEVVKVDDKPSTPVKVGKKSPTPPKPASARKKSSTPPKTVPVRKKSPVPPKKSTKKPPDAVPSASAPSSPKKRLLTPRKTTAKVIPKNSDPSVVVERLPVEKETSEPPRVIAMPSFVPDISIIPFIPEETPSSRDATSEYGSEMDLNGSDSDVEIIEPSPLVSPLKPIRARAKIQFDKKDQVEERSSGASKMVSNLLKNGSSSNVTQREKITQPIVKPTTTVSSPKKPMKKPLPALIPIAPMPTKQPKPSARPSAPSKPAAPQSAFERGKALLAKSLGVPIKPRPIAPAPGQPQSSPGPQTTVEKGRLLLAQSLALSSKNPKETFKASGLHTLANTVTGIGVPWLSIGFSKVLDPSRDLKSLLQKPLPKKDSHSPTKKPTTTYRRSPDGGFVSLSLAAQHSLAPGSTVHSLGFSPFIAPSSSSSSSNGNLGKSKD